MSQYKDEAIARIREDHDYMIDMIRRITASCSQIGLIENCNDCTSAHRQFCNASIESLIRAFVEFTLKHNLTESMYMEECVPPAHRAAHNLAHMDIAEHLKRIRVVFAKDGNGILAIEGIEETLRTLKQHFKEFDRELEEYLLATV